MAETIARPSPLPSVFASALSKRPVRRSSVWVATAGPSFATINCPSLVSVTSTGAFCAPWRRAFSTRFRHRIPNASGSISDKTGVSGKFNIRRPFSVLRAISSTTTRVMVLTSALWSIRSLPPSARASCRRRSDSRARRLSVASISAARASMVGSLVSDRSRCAWAIAPANGVLSS